MNAPVIVVLVILLLAVKAATVRDWPWAVAWGVVLAFAALYLGLVPS